MPTTAHPRRRLVARTAAVACLALLLSACQNVWGVRESYRNYIAGPIAKGEIVASDGAEHLEGGAGLGGGAFSWTVASSTFNPANNTGSVQLSGTVATRGHHTTGDVWILDATFANPRLDIYGNIGVLYADITFRPYQGTNPNPVPPKQSVTAAPLAIVDLSGVDWTPDDYGMRTIKKAPMAGWEPTMELIGWDLFYGNPVTLDPISLYF